MTDWNSHFRSLSKQPKAQAEFGTVGGLYTVAELKDLIAAKDADLANLAVLTKQAFQSWQTKDSNSANAWHNDYQSLLSRYATAKTQGASMAWSAFMPDSMTPADDAYKGVLTAINPLWQSNTNAPGSLGDLNLRLAQGSQQALANPRPIPQPSPSSDFDLKRMQNAGQAAAYVPSPLKTAIATFVPGIVPNDATNPQYKPFDAKQFAKDHWEGLAVGTVGLLVTLKVLAKVGI